jgi:hypothetical protein
MRRPRRLPASKAPNGNENGGLRVAVFVCACRRYEYAFRVIDDISMEGHFFPAVGVRAGKVRLAGIDRGVDELPRDTFIAQLPGRPALIGEWRRRWAENGNDFDVEVVSFGYSQYEALGVGAIQLKFTTDERTLVEDLVRALFSNPLARQMHYSFRPERKGRFLGNVYFLPGWMPAK